MNKLKRHIAIPLLIIMAFASIPSFGDTFYIDQPGTEESRYEVDKREGEEDGAYYGALDGEIDGIYSVEVGTSGEPNFVYPNSGDVSNTYNLNSYTSTYKTFFLRAYTESYEAAFHSAFRALKTNGDTHGHSQAAIHGYTLGKAEAAVYSTIDFVRETESNWRKAFLGYEREKTLVERFRLDDLSSEYAYRFKEAFRVGFMEQYHATYQDRNMQAALNNINNHVSYHNEKTIIVNEYEADFNSGSETGANRQVATLTIPGTTVLEPTYFNLTRLRWNPRDERMMLHATANFEVTINNNIGVVELDKPLTLTINYKGSEDAGIYKWDNGKWVYQYSVLHDDHISTEIPAGVYTGGEYCVFIDESAPYATDIRLNWAFEEIYTMMRRGMLPSSETFNPDGMLTKAELALWLYNSSPSKSMPSMPLIMDVSDDSMYKTAVQYAVSNGYMSVDANFNFGPEMIVTYEAFEDIMEQVTRKTYLWDDVANDIMRSNFVKSPGLSNKRKGMKRSEGAYAIYDWLNDINQF